MIIWYVVVWIYVSFPAMPVVGTQNGLQLQ